MIAIKIMITGNNDSRDTNKKIRVVVADDSPFICRLLTQYLESDPAIYVVKTANNGKEAWEAVKKYRPDVLTLDLNMPVLSGYDAMKHIMAETPTAIVLISGVSKEAARMTKMGLAMGAVDFVLKYSPGQAIAPETLRKEIISKVKAAARVKVIRSIPSINMRFKATKQNAARLVERPAEPALVPHPIKTKFYQIVIIGASTGGPLALKALLTALGKETAFRNNPFPVIIVQHMPEGFTEILATQFNRIFPFPVKEAADGDGLSAGTVLVAPGNRHLIVKMDGTVGITNAPEINGHRPSIDVTMQSAAHAFGNHVTGVILSGMGDDGAQGLLAIKSNCGKTFAQTRDSCVIDTMPYSAIRLGIVQQIGDPEEIGRWLGQSAQADKGKQTVISQAGQI